MKAITKLKRTNETDLTEDELLILDALFEANNTYKSLRKKNYALYNNLPYSHNLDDRELRYSIKSLLQRGIIFSKTEACTDRKTESYGLTNKGGNLWERERKPMWDSYCIDSSYPVDYENISDEWILEVGSPCLETAKAFLHTAWKMHLFCFNVDDVNIKFYESYIPFTWEKNFSSWYILSVTTKEQDPPVSINWELYDISRRWWRSIPEMFQSKKCIVMVAEKL
jgi:hypothetical protein